MQDNIVHQPPRIGEGDTAIPTDEMVGDGATAANASGAETATPDLAGTVTDAYTAAMRGEFTEATSGLVLNVVVPGVKVLLMLIVAYFAARLLSRWTSNFLCEKVDKTLGKFGGRLVYYAIMAIACLTILQTAGIGVASFAAVLAAAGFAIGLAFQGTLSNFAAGILLLVFRPFRVGDVVNTAGVLGKVNAIDLFTTTFDTPDNRRLIVPNSSITNATIENVTFHPERRVEVVVGVSYSASLDDTRDVLVACAESMASSTIQGEGRGYQVILANLGGSSVDWKIRLWTRSENFFAVQEELTEEIKRQLDDAAIEIPFPQLQLHLTETPSGVMGTSGSSSVGNPLPMPKMNMLRAEEEQPIATEHRAIRPRPRTGSVG